MSVENIADEDYKEWLPETCRSTVINDLYVTYHANPHTTITSSRG